MQYSMQYSMRCSMQCRVISVCGALVLVMAALVTATPQVHAAVPHHLSVQGVLSDSYGNPISNSRTVTFRIYDAAIAGGLLWNETQFVMLDINGRYSVLLGSIVALDLPFTQDYWLSVEVETDGEMMPRYRIVSSAYAYNSETVNGIHASAIPTSLSLLALDGTGKFPNSVLKTGTGGGFDADLLDGSHGTDFAGAVHTHAGTSITSAVAQAEDADTVDGKHAAGFADMVHNHNALYVPSTTLSDVTGVLNAPANPVDWSQLKSVPADIADGDADTTYVDGTGILISGSTISANMGGLPSQVAAGDHDHNTAYVNDNAGEIDSSSDFGFATTTFVSNLDADRLDGKHGTEFAVTVHTHTGTDVTSPVNQATDADTVDGKHAVELAGAVHAHAGGDITSVVALATDADTVDGIHASAMPTANQVLALDGAGKFSNSVLNVGTGADQLVALDGAAKLPPVDGSQLQNLPQGALVPVGGVVAWLKSYTSTPALPGDFAECNGQVLSDPDSPYNGQALPNMNGAQRFLRGSTASGATGGASSHNHQWLALSHGYRTRYQTKTVTNSSSQTWASDGSTKIQAGSFETWTNNSSGLPPFYNVVWIIRIK